MPPYYLVYYLLVDLLGYQNLGKFEKVAWSIPIDFEGKAFLVDYRKFGLGVFVDEPERNELLAENIVKAIERGVRLVRPYYEWIAKHAVHSARFNVKNMSGELYRRFEYFLSTYRAVQVEADLKADISETITEEEDGGVVTSITRPNYHLRHHAQWMAESVVDAFFVWTEHVFVHIGIVTGRVTDGGAIAELVAADWGDKFKAALSLDNQTTKRFYDQLIELRRQVRNFTAHGAFGKQGQAFTFHSPTGAVPVVIENLESKPRFSLTPTTPFADAEAVKLTTDFSEYIWSGDLEPFKLYIQENSLPAVVPYAQTGRYRAAARSVDSMAEFIDALTYEWDRSANMDW